MPDDLEGAAKYTFWSKEEARERFYVNGEECCGAVSYRAGSLSAYKFVCGLLALCLPSMNFEFYTNTPAVSLSPTKGKDGWVVETLRGNICAQNVVLATNAYTASLLPAFQGHIVPMRGQITAHRPGSAMPASGLPTTYSFIYANGYEYMIPRPQGSKYAGDIVIGGGLVIAANEGEEEFGTIDDCSVNPTISKYLYETTSRYFGSSWGEDDEDGRVRREWSGIMGFSGDGFPFVGQVPKEEGLWVAASFQGHGMVLCWRIAEALVKMMQSEEQGLGDWFPEAFRVTEERMRIPFTGRLHLKPLKEGDGEGDH